MRNRQALMGIGLIGVYSVVMVVTEGSAPLAWVTLGAGLLLLAAGARIVVGEQRAHRD